MRLLTIKKRPFQSTLTSEHLLRSPVKSEGVIKTEDDMFIDTTHRGDIQTTGHITIGPNGNIRGSLQARAVSLQGSVVGDVVADETITLDGGSSVTKATMTARAIVIQPGSQLKDVKLTTTS